jgi:hypothetical protein
MKPVPSHPLKRRFTPAEDAALRGLVSQFGLNHWTRIAEFIPERTARQCRDRYEHYLESTTQSTPWTPQEDDILRNAVRDLGHRWREIAVFLPGRNANSLKNHWHKVLAKGEKYEFPRSFIAPETTSVVTRDESLGNFLVFDDSANFTVFEFFEDSSETAF